MHQIEQISKIYNNITETGDIPKEETYGIKGYLRYKMITSQNVPFEAWINNFFIL